MDFLISRTQWVIVKGENSSQANVTSGVPQGSVSGPLLFLIYINDLPTTVKSEIRLFAYDSYIHKVINNIQDSTGVQMDINSLLN